MGTAATQRCGRCCYKTSVLKSPLTITLRRGVWILQTALAPLHLCDVATLRLCDFASGSLLFACSFCARGRRHVSRGVATPARVKRRARLPRDFGGTATAPATPVPVPIVKPATPAAHPRMAHGSCCPHRRQCVRARGTIRARRTVGCRHRCRGCRSRRCDAACSSRIAPVAGGSQRGSRSARRTLLRVLTQGTPEDIGARTRGWPPAVMARQPAQHVDHHEPR